MVLFNPLLIPSGGGLEAAGHTIPRARFFLAGSSEKQMMFQTYAAPGEEAAAPRRGRAARPVGSAHTKKAHTRHPHAGSVYRRRGPDEHPARPDLRRLRVPTLCRLQHDFGRGGVTDVNALLEARGLLYFAHFGGGARRGYRPI